MQAEERAGSDIDADQDGVANELTIADITAIILFQAALDAPHFLEPKDKQGKEKVARGDNLFSEIKIDRALERFENAKNEKDEIINDLIVAAHNDAREKLKKKTSEELLKVSGASNLPFDFKLPF